MPKRVERISQLRRRRVRRVALVATLLVPLLIAAYLVLTWRDLRQQALDGVMLYARVLENQTDASLDNTNTALETLAERLELIDSETVAARLPSQMLVDALSGQPLLRSLSLLDVDGRVLTSTNPENLDRMIHLDELGGLPRDRRPVLGRLLKVRDLAQLDDATSPGHTALPLMRRVERADAPPVVLVAVLNPDRFETQQAVLLGQVADRTALFSYQGQLLARGMAVSLEVGSSHAHLPPFAQHLPAREHGSYVGTGMDGGRAIAAFLTLDNWPLVLLIERPYEELRRAMVPPLIGALSVGGAAWAAIALIAFSLSRRYTQDYRAARAVSELHGEIARSEELLKLALQGAGDGVWEWNVDNGQVSCSPRSNAILEYPEHDSGAQLTNLAKLVHPDDVARVTQEIKDHVKGRASLLHTELRMRCRGGAWKWVLVRGMLTPHKGGQSGPRRLIGTLTDISDRKATESALAASRARKLAILQSSLDAIVTIDNEGRLMDFNPAAEAMFGRRQEEVLGQPISDLVVPAHHRRAHNEGMARYRATRVARILNRRFETEALRADGTIFPIELAIVPVPAEIGEVFTATIRDISDRRASEREREELLDRYKALTAEMQLQRMAIDQHAIVSITDAKGRLISVNRNFCTTVGYSELELLGTDGLRFVRGCGIDEATYATLVDELAQDRPWRGELRVPHRDGSPRWLTTTIAPLRVEWKGKLVTNYMNVQSDVTPLRQAEDALRAAREKELSVGSRIQRSLLVTAAPHSMPGVWVSSFNRASQVIDGDFVEVFQRDDHCMDLIVGDVMGKGINAALMGAAVKMQFSRSMVELMTSRAGRGGQPTPAEVLAAVDQEISPHLQALEAFVTLCYLRIDRDAGTLTWVGCGHEETLLVRRDGATLMLRNQQPPIGVLEVAAFRQDVVAIHPGDALLLHSDGASDAMLPDGQRVGHERLHRAFRKLVTQHPTAAAVLHLLRRDVLGTARSSDDLTLMTVRIEGLESTTRRLEVAPEPASVAQVRQFVHADAISSGLGEVAASLFTVAVVEAFTNVYRHAGGMPDGAPVEILTRNDGRWLTVELVYIGHPCELDPAPAATDFRDYPEGGFGMTIIERACDHVEYLHHEGVNTTRMALRLQTPALVT